MSSGDWWRLTKKLFRLLILVGGDDSGGWCMDNNVGWRFQAFWIVVNLLDGWKHVNGMDGWFQYNPWQWDSPLLNIVNMRFVFTRDNINTQRVTQDRTNHQRTDAFEPVHVMLFWIWLDVLTSFYWHPKDFQKQNKQDLGMFIYTYSRGLSLRWLDLVSLKIVLSQGMSFDSMTHPMFPMCRNFAEPPK